MRRTDLALAGLVLALGAGAAAAQMRPVPQQTVPDVAALLEKVCLPLAANAPVAAGIAAAKSAGFALTAQDARQATLQKGSLVINLAPGNCVLTVNTAGPATYPHVDHELSGWLPRLGRYWAGPEEADAAGMGSRKFRAGGHTVLVWEVVDEDERQVNVNIGK